MSYYYVNNEAQSSGEHEMHREGCAHLTTNRVYLGYFFNCQDALEKARTIYSEVNGCIHCSADCHSA